MLTLQLLPLLQKGLGQARLGRKKRQLRVQTANLQLAQLTVSGNEIFFVREN